MPMDAKTCLTGAFKAAVADYNQANPTAQLTDQQVFAKLVTFFQAAL